MKMKDAKTVGPRTSKPRDNDMRVSDGLMKGKDKRMETAPKRKSQESPVRGAREPNPKPSSDPRLKKIRKGVGV